jgi:SAM-dependent methyltransferase
MSRWDQTVTHTAGDAKRFWADATLDTLNEMMAPAWAWHGWLNVAAGVITEPGTVFEPGCGLGVLADLLPPGCSYYGCDINPVYVEEATRSRGSRTVRFELRDLEDVLDSGETYDWVVVTSLFGMFPESTAYEMIPRFWAATRRGLSVTTVDKRLVSGHRLLRFDFTAHDPDLLQEAAAGLPGNKRVELHRGTEFAQFRGHHWQRGLALYVWREPSGRTSGVRRKVDASSADTLIR